MGIIYRNIAVTEKGLAGGGDVFLVYLLRALKEEGHEIVLLTTEPTRWDIVQNDLGWVFKPDLEVCSSFLSGFGRFRLYRQFLPSPHVEALKRVCDVTFNAYGHGLFWNTDFIYMHTPPTKEELFAKYNRNHLARLYYRTYLSVAERLKERLKTVVLTNSEYSRNIIRETLGLDAKVIPPPVDTEIYRSLIEKNEVRKNGVVTISRLTWEKRLELVPEIASRVQGEAEFHIIGTTPFAHSVEISQAIKRKSSELGVSDRVKLHANLPSKEKLDVLANSKVYLHTRKNEYFGMAIAEAMSAGLIPVVPNEGGQKEVVPGENFTYGSLEEGAQRVTYWLNHWSRSLSNQMSRKAEKFDYKRFKERINTTIKDKKTRLSRYLK